MMWLWDIGSSWYLHHQETHPILIFSDFSHFFYLFSNMRFFFSIFWIFDFIFLFSIFFSIFIHLTNGVRNFYLFFDFFCVFFLLLFFFDFTIFFNLYPIIRFFRCFDFLFDFYTIFHTCVRNYYTRENVSVKVNQFWTQNISELIIFESDLNWIYPLWKLILYGAVQFISHARLDKHGFLTT